MMSSFSNLHSAAFSTHLTHEGHHEDESTAKAIIAWQMIQEFAFLADMFITFVTEYKDLETGDFRRDLESIAIKYIKTTFIMDFLAVFPFFEVFKDQMVYDKGNSDIYNFYHLLYLFKLFRLYKAAQLLKPSYVFSAYTKIHKKYLNWMHHSSHNCGHDDEN
jgi:hypothetical protein